ncbi:MAG: YncE family protein [Ignavibacteria bacterium]|nr:MAG: YncE family protein [Ignavibacteria bacterium]
MAYQIHRSSGCCFTPTSQTLLTLLPPEAATYLDSPLVNGQRYYYRVLPIGQGGRLYRGSGNSTVARPYDYTSVPEISFSKHVQPIFLSGCAVSGCHDRPAPGDNLPAGTGSAGPDSEQFSLANWQDFFIGRDHGDLVVPYRGNKSHVIYHLNSDTLLAPVSVPHMPPVAGISIPPLQLGVIMRWIDEGAPDDYGAVAFTVDPQGKVLVTNQAEDLVAVIDIAANLVARYIQAGVANVFIQPPAAPHNVTVDKAHGYYYVNLVGGGKVLKFRLADNAKLGEVSGILSPTQVALSESGDTGYVAQFASGVNSIRLFDTRSMALVGELSALYVDKPHGVQLTPDRRELWVTGNLSDNIMVVNLQDFSTKLIQLNNQAPGSGGALLPYQTVMTPDNKFVYVSCQLSNEVRLVSRDSMAVVKVIPVGRYPLILAISPDGRYVYSANRNSNSVSVIRTGVDSVVETIADVGPQPHGIDITADGRFAYVSCENVTAAVPPHHPTSGSKVPGFVAVVDLAINQVVKTIEVGAFAAGVAVVQ